MDGLAETSPHRRMIPCDYGRKLIATPRILILILLALALPYHLLAAGPATLNLLSNTNFAILAETTITTTGGGSANGNIGLSPNPGSSILVTCAQVNGTIYAVDASGPPCSVVAPSLLTQAVNDMTTSYNDAAGRSPVPTGPNLNPGTPFSTGYDIGGLTLAPGLYKFGSGETAFINSSVTLNGGPSDVWIFQCGADLEEANGVHITLAGGANANNIFWQVSTKAVIGTTAIFNGTILAGTSITMNTGSTMNGRALAQAEVTFNGTGATLPVTAPGIVIQQPLGTDLTNGVSTNNFGSVAVGTNTSLTFTITNTGSANLTGLGITVGGADSSMFTVTTNPVTPVIPGGSTTFTVSFAPASMGVQNATLQIASNDTNNNPFDITIIGTGTAVGAAAGIVVQQPVGKDLTNGVSTNNFGSVAVGTNTSLTFTITNTGSANLTGLAITVGGADSSMFTVTTNPVTPVIPGGSTTFTVSFAPASMGVQTATLQIASNDTNNNPFEFTITGTGAVAGAVAGIVVQQPAGTDLTNGVSTNNFGSVTVGTNTSLTFTITNAGTANLTGLAITVGGTDASMFTVTTNPVAPVIPDGSTTFTVSFAPASMGVQSATLQIASNDTNNNPFDITIIGTGTAAGPAARIVVQQPAGTDLTNGVSTNNFGSVAVGTNTSLTFTITNTGSANLTGLGITVGGADSSIFTVTTNPVAPVIPGGSTTFTVSFAPASIGVQNATLQIASNDANNNPFEIFITGTGTVITSTTNATLTYTSFVTMDPQIGLFTNSVIVTNGTPNTIPAIRLLIENLPADVQVYNESGSTTNGIPYVQYNFSLLSGATVDFMIEYYRSDRQPFLSPTYVVQDLTNAVTLGVTNGVGIGIDKIMSLNGGMLVEFYTTPGRTYAVQYSTNQINWLTADPFIIAPANYVQWFDQGPPQTAPLTSTRFYRAFELP